MQLETTLMLLFIVATAVAIGVRRIAVPYTVALVLAGLGLGLVHAFEAPNLTKALLFNIFLPGLIFEAAFHIDFKQFWRNRIAITSLALPGVVAATAVTTLILTPVADSLHFEQDFNWRYALVFGALISATDPIAVVAIFKSLGVPKRLAVLVDGESLLNDGTAIVFFTLSLALVNGAAVNTGGLAWDFVRIVGIGALIGAGVGLGVSQVISLPAVFPHRDLLVSMTFGVVILSILVHGLTMSPLLRWLKVVQGHEQRATSDFLRGKLQAARAALEELNKMVHVHFTRPEVLAGLRREYEQKLEHDKELLKRLHLEKRELETEELRWARRHLLLVEKGEVTDAFHHGVVSQTVHEKILADVDARLLRLESGEIDGSIAADRLSEQTEGDDEPRGRE